MPCDLLIHKAYPNMDEAVASLTGLRCVWRMARDRRSVFATIYVIMSRTLKN